MDEFKLLKTAKVAYDGYRDYSNGKSLVSGDPLPEWGELPDRIKVAWMVSTRAALDFAKQFCECGNHGN